MSDERLRRQNRIHHSKEFQAHFRRACRQDTAGLILFIRLTETAGARLGLAVNRKLGKAVDRNRLKRRLREIFRKRKNGWLEALGHSENTGLDIIIRPKGSAVQCSYLQLDQQITQAVEGFLSRRKPITNQNAGGSNPSSTRLDGKKV